MALFAADLGMEQADPSIRQDQGITVILTEGDALLGQPHRGLTTIFELQFQHGVCAHLTQAAWRQALLFKTVIKNMVPQP